jgi:hypothetical protein
MGNGMRGREEEDDSGRKKRCSGEERTQQPDWEKIRRSHRVRGGRRKIELTRLGI